MAPHRREAGAGASLIIDAKNERNRSGRKKRNGTERKRAKGTAGRLLHGEQEQYVGYGDGTGRDGRDSMKRRRERNGDREDTHTLVCAHERERLINGCKVSGSGRECSAVRCSTVREWDEP